MTSLDALIVAMAIKEAERQRDDLRETIELLETPGLKLTAEGQDAFAQGISGAKQRLARIERLIQKLRRKEILMSARFRLRVTPRRSAQG